MDRYKIFNILGHFPMIFLIASCSETLEFPTYDDESNDAVVELSISVNAPEMMGTRGTPGDVTGETINYLHWSLFEIIQSEDGTILETKHVTDYEKSAFNDGKATSETITIALPRNKKYRIAMMAKYKGNLFTSFSKGVMTVDYSRMSSYTWPGLVKDVFVGSSGIIDPVSGYGASVTLKRPFAQINWGSSDIESTVVNKLYSSKYIVNESIYDYGSNSIYQKLDILTNEVSSPVTKNVTYKESDIKCINSSTYTFPSADGISNKLFQTVYLLVDQKESSTLNCRMEFSAGYYKTTVEVNNAPVQANHRTNIYGALMTDPNVFSIDMSEGFITGGENVTTDQHQDIIAKIMSGEDVEIPEGTTVDISDCGRPALKNGQTITVNGTLRVNTMQLYISGSGKTLTIDGTGLIYCNSVNTSQVIYSDNGATINMKDVTVYSTRNGSGTTVYAIQGGNLDLDNVTVHTSSWGIVCDGNGYVNAKDCKVYYCGNTEPGVMGVKNGAVGTFINCETYSDIFTLNLENAEVSLDNCRFNVRKREGSVNNYNLKLTGVCKLTILSGYYKTAGNYSIYRTAIQDGETESSVEFDIRGGHFSSGFGCQDSDMTINPASGYKLINTDDPEFPFEVVPE